MACVQLYIRIPASCIAMLRFLTEGYDGLAIVSTVDTKAGLVRLLLPRSRYDELLGMLSGFVDECICPVKQDNEHNINGQPHLPESRYL